MSFLQLPEDFIPDRALDNPRLEADKKYVLAELDGPGCIRHIWMTVRPIPLVNRRIVIRIYWDDEPEPSVEAPLGDLFGLCHGIPFYEINSLYLSVKGQSGLNCYFPMPFSKSARIEAETGPLDNPINLYYHIDWHRYPDTELEEDLRFHAKWRREYPTQAFREEYTVMNAVGRGHLLGFVYGLRLYDDAARWSHGGTENVYIDGEGEPAFLRGSGGEDTFGTGAGGVLHDPETHLDAGIPYYYHEDTGAAQPSQRLAAYRFFKEDAITFKSSVHFRFGCVANDICSTVYWYQTEPHKEFFKIPPWDQVLPGIELKRGECDIEGESGGEWWLCGPFENVEGEGMNKTLPPENEFKPDATYNGGFKEDSPWLYPGSGYKDQHIARWLRRREINRFIDFNHVFRPWHPGVAVCWPALAYALTWLEADHEGEAVLSITWDDELRLRMNDGEEMILGDNTSFRRKEVKVKLNKGRNKILLKLSNTKGGTWGAWCYAFRARLSDGSILKPKID